jgi:transposase
MTISTLPGPNSIKIQLSKRQEQYLKVIVNKRTSHQGTVTRAKIILMAGEGMANAHIAPKLGLHPDSVRLWRQRWAKSQQKLDEVELKTFSPEEVSTKSPVIDRDTKNFARKQFEHFINGILSDLKVARNFVHSCKSQYNKGLQSVIALQSLKMLTFFKEMLYNPYCIGDCGMCHFWKKNHF